MVQSLHTFYILHVHFSFICILTLIEIVTYNTTYKSIIRNKYVTKWFNRDPGFVHRRCVGISQLGQDKVKRHLKNRRDLIYVIHLFLLLQP